MKTRKENFPCPYLRRKEIFEKGTTRTSETSVSKVTARSRTLGKKNKKKQEGKETQNK